MSYRITCVSMRWLGMLLLCLSGVAHASTDGWISATPLPSGVVINDMDCRTDGLCVAVGLGGSILTSTTDGLTWARQDSHTMHRLYDVVYAGPSQGFWVVGEGGVILQGSADGLTWTHRDSGSRKALFSIAYGKFGTGTEVIVAVGQQGVILVSQDLGVTWARPAAAGMPAIFPSYGAVGFFGDRFIAVGSSSAIVESFDGLNWEEALDDQGARLYAPTTGADLNEVASNMATVSGAPRYVVVGERGEVLTSDDGSHWTTRVVMTTTDQELLAITWDGGQFVAVGVNGRMATSPDGVAWADQNALRNASTDAVLRNLVEVHWDQSHSRYLVTGSRAASNNYIGGFIKYSGSNSLSSWTDVSSGPATAIINGVTALDASQGNAFVAVGSGGLVMLSATGNAWALPATSPAVGATALTAVTASGANVFAVSDSGQIYASSDGGRNWPNPAVVPTSNALNAITNDGVQTYVAVGDTGTVVISTDGGTTWGAATSVPSTALNLTGIAWSPTLNLYVATGNSTVSGATTKGIIWTSVDGQTWTELTVPDVQVLADLAIDNDLYAVSWADNRFIAVGKYGLIIYSSDGTTWIGGRATEIAGSLYGIASDGTNLVVVGTVSSGVCPLNSSATVGIYMSNDGGSSWVAHEKLGCDLYGVAWNGTTFVAGGQNGLLVTSGGLDTAVNPLLNASVDTLTSSILPTTAASGAVTDYQLTITNNGNIDLPPNAVQLAVNFALGSEYIWIGATITVLNATTAISCDAVTDVMRPVCTIPVALNVFPLPKGQDQTNRPKEGVDVTVTVMPTAVSGDLTMDFEVLNPGVTPTDQNPINNSLHAVTSVVTVEAPLCSPDAFLTCSSSGGGGGAFAWCGLMLMLLASRARRIFPIAPRA